MTREEVFAQFGGVAGFQSKFGLVADGKAGPRTNTAADRYIRQCRVVAPPDDSPGSDGIRRPDMDKCYGKFNFTHYPKEKIKAEKDKGRVVIDPAWEAENIVEKTLWDGQKIKLHKLVADEFDLVFKEAVEASGYHPKYIVGYKPRHTLWNPNKSLSSHSWGCAVDFEPDNNDIPGVDITLPKVNGKYQPSRMRRNMKFVEVFERHGWCWLGRPESLKDDMHFMLCFH